MREQLSPMGPLWLGQNYKCIFKSVRRFSLAHLVLSERKESRSLFSVSLVGLRQLYIWKSILPSAVELVSCYSPFSCRWKLCLTVWQHHPFPKVQTPMPLGGSRAFFPYTYLLCFAPVFLVRRACKQQKTVRIKMVLKYKIKISLREWNKRAQQWLEPTFLLCLFHLDSPLAVINTVEGGQRPLSWDY